MKHGRVPWNLGPVAQFFQDGLGLGVKGFCRHHRSSIGGQLKDFGLVFVAQIQEVGLGNMSGVRGEDPVWMSGQEDVSVMGAVQVIPSETFHVVGHVLEEQDCRVFGSPGHQRDGFLRRGGHGGKHFLPRWSRCAGVLEKMPKQRLVLDPRVSPLGKTVHRRGAPCPGPRPQGDRTRHLCTPNAAEMSQMIWALELRERVEDMSRR